MPGQCKGKIDNVYTAIFTIWNIQNITNKKNVSANWIKLRLILFFFLIMVFCLTMKYLCTNLSEIIVANQSIWYMT